MLKTGMLTTLEANARKEKVCLTGMTGIARRLRSFGRIKDRSAAYGEARPLLLLTTIGAKSGQRRTNPMMYLREGERLFVFASKGARPPTPTGITICSRILRSLLRSATRRTRRLPEL